jgi:hypothetical protein
MSHRATSQRIDYPRSIREAMHDPALAEFGSERETKVESITNAAVVADTAPAARKRRPPKRDWVGIFTLAFGFLLAAVCLYSALTDPRRTGDARANSNARPVVASPATTR